MLALLENKEGISFSELSLHYQELLKNGVYGDRFLFMQQENLQDLLGSLTSQQINILKEELSSLDRASLYESVLHGYDHIERTMFWTFLLSEKYLSTVLEKRIMMDAAKYHDIGRQNDFEDRKHGMLSAQKVLSILQDPIYQNEENRNLLCATIELHSLNDDDEQLVAEKYQIRDRELFSRMWKILKDADGLDRIRLSHGITRMSALNISYLRLEMSFHLVKASHELCTYYKDYKLKEEKKAYIS